MRFFLSLLACLAFTGCNTTAKHADGTPWFTTYMNAKTFYAKSGNDVFYVDGMDHATPTDVASDGITDALATAASGAFALQNPTATGAAVLLAPHVTPRVVRPPRRVKPKPVPVTAVIQP